MIDTESKSILLVEDEMIIALMEKRQLEQEGYKVVHAATGEQAIDLIRSGQNRIDLILSGSSF